MKLYHYSFAKEILEEGLEPFISHNDTKIINKLICNRFNDYFNRDYCVFFNEDFRDVGDITVSVDTDNLDKSCLYVADQDIANNIYNNWYRGVDCNGLIDNYVESIKSFSGYKNEYSNSEIFYAEYVSPELFTIEYISEDIETE